MRAGLRVAGSALWLLAGLAGGTALAETGKPPPQRTSTVVIYGDDPCPKGEGDEIIVCARKPESERYRIPKDLREDKEKRTEQAWGTRAIAAEEESRVLLPNSCSVIGSGGQTGCFQQMLRQWAMERRAMQTNPGE